MIDEEAPVYKLFITHLEGDDEEYQLFLSKLKDSYDLEWEDHAVQNNNEPEQIKEQMEQVDAVVVLSGLIGKDEKLLTRQIQAARELGKPIVVIRPYGMENVPFNLENIASEVVGWNAPCIVDAIKEAVNGEEEL
ncbi:MAG: TIR domain-containing protein [Methanobacterium sp.]|nr:TIR domain-containing protein [Methanobacterium sp.]